MKIKWIAHSCFLITLESGTTLLFDPFDDTIGYSRPDMSTDIVLMSHDHYDHNDICRIKPGYELIRTSEQREFNGVKIYGIDCYHDHHEGSHRGKNIVFIVEAEGMRIAHCGDLGHIPDDAFFEKLGKIDVLLIPVGGVFTIGANEAVKICKRIMPNIIIPMHYKTIFLDMDLDAVYHFTDAAKTYFDRATLGQSSFTITADSLKKRPRIIVMQNSFDC